MIITIKNKAIKLFYEKDDHSKLPRKSVEKIRNIITRLEFCEDINDVNFPSSKLHKLSGKLKDFWSVKVDENYRIIFQIDKNKIYDIDFIDYH